MEVTVSEPCDVFRVLKGFTIAAMADLWTFKAARDKFLPLNKVFSKRGSCFRYIISVTPLRSWLPCILQNQLRRWKRILLLEIPPLNESIDPSALLSFLYMEKYTGRWADSRDPPVYPVDHLRIQEPLLWHLTPGKTSTLRLAIPGRYKVGMRKIPWSWQNIRMSNVSLFRGTDRVPRILVNRFRNC